MYGLQIPRAFLTAGATRVPNNSIDFIVILWGTVPTLAWAKKRVNPNNSCSYKILSMTCATLPTINAPLGDLE